MIKEQPNGAAYYITDKTGYDSFYRIRKHVGLGYYAEVRPSRSWPRS